VSGAPRLTMVTAAPNHPATGWLLVAWLQRLKG
jgi:hypothetical protein